MTTADLQDYLAQVLQETFGTTEFFTVDEINSYIDEAFIETVLKVPELDYLSLLDSVTANILANRTNWEYDLTTLPDFFRLSHILIPPADGWTLDENTADTYNSIKQTSAARQIQPEELQALLANRFYKPDITQPVYYIEGKKLKVNIGDDFYKDDTTYTIYYFKLPSTVTTANIDNKFTPIMKAYCLYRAYMKNENFNQADRYYKQYQDDITQLKAIYKGGIQ